jgi:hypothetical protein
MQLTAEDYAVLGLFHVHKRLNLASLAQRFKLIYPYSQSFIQAALSINKLVSEGYIYHVGDQTYVR